MRAPELKSALGPWLFVDQQALDSIAHVRRGQVRVPHRASAAMTRICFLAMAVLPSALGQSDSKKTTPNEPGRHVTLLNQSFGESS
jgi:hypothetical protein